MLATRLGAAATDQLAAGNAGVLVGVAKGEVIATPLAEVVSGTKPLDPHLLALARVLAK
jgi:6-phosphofructokinase 1